MTAFRVPPAPLALAAFAVAVLLGLAASPAWLPPDLGAAVHGGFAWLCHQLPARSPHTHGVPWALCHRCLGILAGVGLGLAMAPALPARAVAAVDRLRPGCLIVVALVPLAVDWSLMALGLWTNTPASRVATGVVFGLAAGVVLALALRQPARAHPSPNLLTS